MVKVRKDKNNTYTKLLKDKKGISPVITTVILVAVGIALAVAIGLWMSGLVSTFTRFEKLEVSDAYAVAGTTSGTWTAYVTAKNTGSADATITMIMINGVPIVGSGVTTPSGVTGVQYSLNGGTSTNFPNTGVTVSVGSAATFTISLTSSGTIGSTRLTSGITLNIVLHSAAGKDYPASVTLP